MSKYRLGNECEVWSETHFTMVTYAGDDGVVATVHFMPTVFIPTTYIGYSPTGRHFAALNITTSTGATLSFPNLYVDIEGIPWLFGGTAWVGTRYYKRESVYISDFFYWNPSGVGGGVEDIKLGKDLRLSYAVFAVDGEPSSPRRARRRLPLQIDFGFRNDLQLRGIKLWPSGEFQLGFQYIVDFSNTDHGDHAPTAAGASPSSTCRSCSAATTSSPSSTAGAAERASERSRASTTRTSRVYHDPASAGFGSSTCSPSSPSSWLGAPGRRRLPARRPRQRRAEDELVLGGRRVSLASLEHFKVLGEVGYDRVKKSNGSDPQC